MTDIKIHDIKNLSVVSDWSFYIFLILILCALVLFSFLIYLLIKKIKNKKVNSKKIYLEKLKNIDLNLGKNAAYEITQYIHLLNKDDIQKQLSKKLINDLNTYKYKKESTGFNEPTKILFKKFLETYE